MILTAGRQGVRGNDRPKYDEPDIVSQRYEPLLEVRSAEVIINLPQKRLLVFR